jgi:anaerobic selenocysteine-containing dehydrogenase
MLVTVEHRQGRRVAVRVVGDPTHPPTGGVLCTKVSRYLERTYHADRVLHPLRRVGRKGSGQFERIGWDEAIATIAARLKTIAAVDPQRIVPYSYAGTMGLVQGEAMAKRFFHRLGASLLDRTICSSAGGEALDYTLGARKGTDVEQIDHSRLILLWGTNAIASNLHLWSRVQEAKRRGAKLVAIDPYRSLTAEKCHEHIALLPGTDGALALGLIHVLVREDWLDHDYIARHTLGFDALAARAAQWPPARVAAVCGIAAAQVEALARDYAQVRPAVIRLNYGMQRAHGGGNAVRAVACLPALAGHWRDAAGGLLLSTSGEFEVDGAAMYRPDLLAGRTPRTVNMSTIGADLLAGVEPPAPRNGTAGATGDTGAAGAAGAKGVTGIAGAGTDRAAAAVPIEALIVYNSNPVAVAPDSARVAAGFAREDLFTVVLEHFMTDTADHADIVLPATTQLEHVDVHKAYGHLYLVANNAAIAPLGEARPNSAIFRALAAAMGFDDPCFADDDDTLAAQAFRRSGTTADYDWPRLKQAGWARLALPLRYAPFAEGGFPTPSGKCEFVSARLAALGLDPLPDYVPPYEGPTSNAALAARFPLAIISPPARNFLNSTFVNVRSLRDTEGEPALEIHPADAQARGIGSGDRVRVFNDRGSFQLLARVTDRARPGCVVALSIWWKKLAADGRNANEVTSLALTDIGRAPTFYDCLVEVERLR